MRRASLASRSPAALSPNQALIASAVLVALAVPAAAQLQFEELPRKGFPVGTGSTNDVAIGDVDGDGDLDMVVANGGQNRLLLNDGTGTFTEVTATQMPVDNDNSRAVALGDVDGDGDLDLVFGNGSFHYYYNYGEQNRLYLNDGTGTFSDASASQMPGSAGATNSVALGDVDGDGDLDIVWGNIQGQNGLYLNNGSGVFTNATAAQMPVDGDWTNDVALGDVDGDGDLDLVCGNASYDYYSCSYYQTIGGQNRLYLNNGSGVFTDATAQISVQSNQTLSIVLGDVDGDGDLDLACGNAPYGVYFYPYGCNSQTGGWNVLYLNDGSGVFTGAWSQIPSYDDTTSSVALGDIDGDGDLDMVIGNQYGGYYSPTGQTRLWVNDGTGTFSDATATQMPVDADRTSSVAVGDVDGDGDLDMVIGNLFGDPNRLYLNLQRQLHAPVAPQIGQPYDLDAYMRYGPASTVDIAAVYLSTAAVSIPLGALGTLGIDPALAAPFPTLIVPQPAGVGSVGFTVPNVPAFIGQEIYSQAMLVAFPNELRLSNVVADVIQ